MMRIAIIITSLEIGGAERVVLELTRRLQQCFEIILYIINKDDKTIYNEMAIKYQLNIVYLGNRQRFFNIYTYKKLKKHLDKFQPRIIHTHLKSSDYIYLYSLYSKTSFCWIHTVHTIPKVDCRLIRRLIYRPLYNKRKIKLIAVSKTIKEQLLKLYLKANIQTIYNGIDLKRFNYRTGKKEHFALCHVGRFSPIKNHSYLVKEFKGLVPYYPSVRLILIGSGKKRPKIQKYIQKNNLGENVRFVKETSTVNKYLEQADIFVLPSRYEGFSLALLEAMACGLIVITGPWGTEIIEEGKNGFIIDLKPSELINKLRFIIGNIDNLEDVRKEAARTAGMFSLEKQANNYKSIYLKELK